MSEKKKKKYNANGMVLHVFYILTNERMNNVIVVIVEKKMNMNTNL